MVLDFTTAAPKLFTHFYFYFLRYVQDIPLIHRWQMLIEASQIFFLDKLNLITLEIKQK